MGLLHVAVFAGPAHAPAVHLADHFRTLFAEQSREGRVAQAAPGREGVREVVLPVVGFLLAHRHRHGHLRHDGCAPPADEAAVGKDDLRAGAGGLEGRVHTGAAGADHQHVRE